MTLLVSLSTLVSAQYNGKEATGRSMAQLLNYCSTHLDAVIRYKKVTWFLKSTVTPHTCPSQKRVVDQAETSS